MGMISVHSCSDYEIALRQLFPRGEFWDCQFADPESDLSVWCRFQAPELLRFKQLRASLMDEAYPASAVQTLTDWDRVFNVDHSNLSVVNHQEALRITPLGFVNQQVLENCARHYGATVVSIQLIAPACFGFSRFGSRLAGPAYFSVLYVTLRIQDVSLKPSLEEAIKRIVLANQTVHFIYRS